MGRKPVLDRERKARVRRLRGCGHSLRRIAAIVGCSVGTVHAVLKAA